MSLGVSELSAADVAAVCGNNNGNNGGMFGNGNDAWWIIILLLFGWGRGGYGYGGFGGGAGEGGGATPGYVLTSDFANIERKLDGINNGICDSTFALNNTINGNFRTLDGAICNLGYQQSQLANGISQQIAECCCGTQAAIKDVAYGNAMNTNAIDRSIYTLGNSIQSQISSCCCDLEKANMQNRFDAQAYNCNTLQAIDKLGDRIIDYMAREKTEALRDEVQSLRLSASQQAQNAYLISQLGQKCPEPAYIVQPPQNVTFPTNCCGQVAYASNGCNGCGGF